MTDEIEEVAVLSDNFPELPADKGEVIVNYTPLEEQEDVIPS